MFVPRSNVRTVFDRSECQNLKNALAREWLETNGIGGYACSTIIGANTRRQHGLLIASLQPPVKRVLFLSKFEERVACGGHECHISTNLYPGTVYPHGFNIQADFNSRPWPTFRYVSDEGQLEKFVFLVHGENTVVVGYHNAQGRGPMEIKIRPFLAFRDANGIGRRNDALNLTVDQRNGSISVQPDPQLPRLFFHAEVQSMEAKPDWYYRFIYPVEQERGMEFEEDLFSPFELTLKIAPGRTGYVVTTIEPRTNVHPEELVARERKRREKFDHEPDPVRKALWISAQSFLARRGADDWTVLAGYPWFTDWGRDTMIALPGLALSTGNSVSPRKSC